jgi:methylase of polypeptide subunit release factors
MAHWAEIDENNIVTRLTVGDNNSPDEGYQWLMDNLGGTWVKTSYNNKIRRKFAAIGDLYNAELDIFEIPWALEYRQGYVDFAGLQIPIGINTYIPKWDEFLFIEVLTSNYNEPVVAVEIGAGSGALSAAFASRVAGSKVYAIEPSEDAFIWTTATANAFAQTLQVVPLNVDAEEAQNAISEQVDVVFSAPAQFASPKLLPLDRNFVAQATFSGVDGLDMIRGVISSSAALLKPQGALYLYICNPDLELPFGEEWETPEYLTEEVIKIVKK